MLKTKLLLAVITMLAGTLAFAQPISVEGAEEIVEESASSSLGEVATKLANPVAAMISLPIQGNYQQKENGHTWLTNVQPVVPIDVSENWNIISRTIVPIVVNSGAVTTSGIGDIVQSAWLSPKSPTESGWIWGAGAAFFIPTDSDVSLRKWGVGPTALALKQTGPWTYGGLFNHIWSTGGSDSLIEDIDQTFMQPFLTYITPQAVTFALNTESTYDWEREQWTVPINFNVTKVTKVGDQIISYGAGATYWVDAPDGQQEGWGVRLQLTFIFPK